MRRWWLRWLDEPNWKDRPLLARLRLFTSPEFVLCVLLMLAASRPLQMLAGVFADWLAPLPGAAPAPAELLQRRETIGGIVEIAGLVVLFAAVLLVGRAVRGRLGTRPLFLGGDEEENGMEGDGAS